MPFTVSDKLQPFRCDICDRRYKSKCNLNRHKRTTHVPDDQKPFVCTICGKLFPLNCELRRHSRVHSSDRPFKCSFCQKGFLSLGHKKDHETAMHGAIGRFWCAHCDEKFSRKEKLLFHLQTNHFPELEKPFTCNVCDKSFAFKRMLKDHAVVHESKRPFECPKCDLSFKLATYRKKHMRKVHEAGVRYYCAYCNKSYRHKQTLPRHILIHHSYPVKTLLLRCI